MCGDVFFIPSFTHLLIASQRVAKVFLFILFQFTHFSFSSDQINTIEVRIGNFRPCYKIYFRDFQLPFKYPLKLAFKIIAGNKGNINKEEEEKGKKGDTNE